MKIIGDGTVSACITYDADLKSHLRVFDDSDEDLITLYINSATYYIMKYTGLPLFYTDMIVYTCGTTDTLELPRLTGDITLVEGLIDNVWTEFTSDYDVENYGTYQLLRSEDFVYGREYRVTAEVDSNGSDLSIARQVAYLMVGEMYENREDKPEKFTMKSSRLLDMITVFI